MNYRANARDSCRTGDEVAVVESKLDSCARVTSIAVVSKRAQRMLQLSLLV